MPELKITYDDKEIFYDTDNFNEGQKNLYTELTITQRELNRYSYLTVLLDQRKKLLLKSIVEAEDEDKKET